MSLTPAHTEMLMASAITQEVIGASGIYSTPSGLVFPWSDGVGPTVEQRRPDKPWADEDGKPKKYLFPKGAKVPFNRLRDGDTYGRLIIAEGTKQSYAVLSHAPADFGVYGMSGCWGFKHADISVAMGREVFLLLDADYATNVDVYAAAEQLTKTLKRHGAKAVKYVATTGTGKEGVDDTLAGFAEPKRAEMLKVWLAAATDKLGRRPAAKQPTDGASKYFRAADKPIRLQPAQAATDLMAKHPAAITREKNVALYQGGVYRVDEDAVLAALVSMFDDYYTPSVRVNVTEVLRGKLALEGRVLPERSTMPLLNCINGMVDLETGKVLPHDPSYMSSVQLSTEYLPDMPTPVYDAWLVEALRQPGAGDLTVAALVDDLEEVAGTMLDPTRTPSKALFLFGPSRSGKSTFLRLLKAVAGAINTSAVTLHSLATDPFAAANLYNRMLNVAADLSSAHVADLSLFKMITGEDVIQGNRKYGQQFEFTNQALVAFSANELPTVTEASRAYAERMKPFEFPNSFAGREDKHLEGKLMAELPGILARWVKAYSRFLTRGGYSQTDVATMSEFEAKSDRVVQFFQDQCTLTDASYGQRLGDESCTGRRRVSELFNEWAERNGGSKMGERAFFQRLRKIAGVTEVKTRSNGKAFNMVVAKSDDDSWDGDEPVADPIAESGVMAQDVQGDPWLSAEAPEVVDAAPVVAEPVNGAEKAAGDFTLTASAGDTAPASDPWADELGIDYFN